jgi:dephospho-CoA kinase
MILSPLWKQKEANRSEFMIFGVTGFNASGKGEFCNYLAGKGFVVYSLSDIIREELRNEGIEITRDALIAKGNELRQKFGSSVLAKRTMEKFEPGKNYVVDSIRNPGEVEMLRRNKDFKLVFLDAPLKVRYERAKARKREKDAISFEDFKRLEEKEMNSSNSAGQQLIKCREMADLVIVNDSSLKAFQKKIDKISGVLK